MVKHHGPAFDQVLARAGNGVGQTDGLERRAWGTGFEGPELHKFALVHLGKLTLPDLIRRQLILLCGAVFADEGRDFVAGELAAQFGLSGGDGLVALLRPFGKPFEQIRRNPSQFERRSSGVRSGSRVAGPRGQGHCDKLP